MRALRFAVVILVCSGCFGPSERQRRPGAQAGGSGGSLATGGTVGSGGVIEEPDAAAGGTAGGAEADAGTGGAGGTGGRDAAPDAPVDARGPDTIVRDSAAAEASARDAALDARADAGRDLAADLATPDTAAPDTAAPDTASPAPDATGGDPEPGRLAGITRFHNQVRATIPVPDLTWDPALAVTAAAYAAACIFDHSSTPGVGENLAAYAPPGGRSAKAPVDGWASEEADYDYASNSCAPGTICGHYTQMVWKTSLRVGCAVQACSQNSPFDNVTNWEVWVCQYSPPGNVVGRKPY
jgi:uncharacterized protein YkwD